LHHRASFPASLKKSHGLEFLWDKGRLTLVGASYITFTLWNNVIIKGSRLT